MKKQLLVLLLMFASAFALAEDERVLLNREEPPVKISGLDFDQRRFLVEDSWLYFTRGTVVRDYESGDLRAPSSLKNGDWVVIDSRYSRELRRRIIEEIKIVPFEGVVELLDRD